MIILDADNVDMIKEVFCGRDKVVTLDYDDTLIEKTGKFDRRNKLFYLLCQMCEVWIVTSRPHIVYETEFAYDDMISYLKDIRLNIDGLVYNAGNKEILRWINPICHFEDDLLTTVRLTRLGVPVWYAGEMLDEEHIRSVCQILLQQDIAKWYTQHSVFTPMLSKMGGDRT